MRFVVAALMIASTVGTGVVMAAEGRDDRLEKWLAETLGIETADATILERECTRTEAHLSAGRYSADAAVVAEDVIKACRRLNYLDDDI